MEFRKVLALRGPNVWANSPVLEAWVDLGPWKDSPSHTLPGFNERLMSWLPTMVEHHCGIGQRGGFFQRLGTGTYLGHILGQSAWNCKAWLASTWATAGPARPRKKASTAWSSNTRTRPGPRVPRHGAGTDPGGD